MNTTKRKSKLIALWVSKDLKDLITKRAEIQGRSISGFCKQILQRRLGAPRK